MSLAAMFDNLRDLLEDGGHGPTAADNAQREAYRQIDDARGRVEVTRARANGRFLELQDNTRLLADALGVDPGEWSFAQLVDLARALRLFADEHRVELQDLAAGGAHSLFVPNRRPR